MKILLDYNIDLKSCNLGYMCIWAIFEKNLMGPFKQICSSKSVAYKCHIFLKLIHIINISNFNKNLITLI